MQKWRKDKKDRNKTESVVYSICNDVLMYSERMVVHLSLKKQILKEFHTGHPCISRIKSLRRRVMCTDVEWIDIESLVKSCKGCSLAAKASPIKSNPWSETDPHHGHVCILTLLVHLMVHIIWSFSTVFPKWPEILKCKKPTTLFEKSATELKEKQKLLNVKAQQSSSITVLPVVVTKRTSSPSIMSYLPLFVSSPNTTF